MCPASFNLGQNTNNRLECFNGKLKSVCSRHNSILQFFTEFFVLMGALRNERSHAAVMMSVRKSTAKQKDEVFKFCSSLFTPFAAKIISAEEKKLVMCEVKEEVSESNFLVIEKGHSSRTTSPLACSCKHFNNFGLPCRHILSIRKHLNLTLITSETVLPRWNVSCSPTDVAPPQLGLPSCHILVSRKDSIALRLAQDLNVCQLL